MKTFRGALGVWFVAVLWLTLHPGVRLTHLPFWGFLVGKTPSADMARNLLLFAPAGWLLGRTGVRARTTLLSLFGLSLAIELTQFLIPGRVPSASDIAMNVLGTALAWRAAQPARHLELRVAAAVLTFGAVQALWVADLRWSTPVTRIDSDAAGRLRVVGPGEVTYAQVIPVKAEADRRWIRVRNEWTIGAQLGFQPPADPPCPLPWSGTASYVANPAMRCIDTVGDFHWTPRHAGAWIYAIWPEQDYFPYRLEFVGALVFVLGAGLLIRRWPWHIAASYIVGLALVAAGTGLGLPNAFEAAGALIGAGFVVFTQRLMLR